MKRLLNIVVLCLLAIGLSAPAGAVTFKVIEDNGNLVKDASGLGVLGFDVDWVNIEPVLLEVTPEPEEDAIVLAHAGIHPNNPDHCCGPLPGVPWSDYHLEIEASPGAVAPTFVPEGEVVIAGMTDQTPSSLMIMPDSIWMDFDVLETVGVTVFVALDGFEPDVPFMLHVFPTVPVPGPTPVIPEPVTTTLGVMGLGALMLRRRRTT